jgi:hypothetical protein
MQTKVLVKNVEVDGKMCAGTVTYISCFQLCNTTPRGANILSLTN